MDISRLPGPKRPFYANSAFLLRAHLCVAAGKCALLGNWGSCPEPCTPGDAETCPADFDSDCTVGPFDLAFLLGNWGP